VLLSASISGYVIQANAGGGGVPGVTVFMDANRNGELDLGERAVVTDAAGRYEFANTPPGNYNIATLVKDGRYWTANTFDRLIGLGSWEDSIMLGPTSPDQTNDDFAGLWEIDPETGFATNRVPIAPDTRGTIWAALTDPAIVNYGGLTAVPGRPGWYLSQVQSPGNSSWNILFECDAHLVSLYWVPGMAYAQASYVCTTDHDLVVGHGLDFDPTGDPNVVYGGVGDDYIWPWNVTYNEDWMWKADLRDLDDGDVETQDIADLWLPDSGMGDVPVGDLQFDGSGNLYLFRQQLFLLDKTNGQELDRIWTPVDDQAAEWNPETLTFWTAGDGLGTVNPATGAVTTIRSHFDFGIPDGTHGYFGWTLPYVIEGLEYLPDGFTDRPVELRGADVEYINFDHVYHAVGIRGQVFRDDNGNGVRDPGENAAAATQRVFLDANGNGRCDAGETYRWTDNQGHFAFTDQPAGVYRIVVESVFGGDDVTWGGNLRPGYELVNLAEGEIHVVDFGVGPAGKVVGSVFDDLNADSIHQGWLTETDAHWTAPALAITDYTTIQSTIAFDRPGATVADLNVYLDIAHTYVGDLRVDLVSPAGTRVRLIDRAGGAGHDFLGTVLADDATETIQDATADDAPYTGAYRPAEALAAFNGEPVTGTWTLEIADHGGGDVGTLNAWELILTIPAAGEPPLAGVPVYVDLDTNGVMNTVTVQGDAAPALPIPLGGTAESIISISDASGPVADVDVYLDLSHPWVGHLIIDLISPRGTFVRLTRFNGESGTNFTGTIFDDEALVSIEDAVGQDNPFPGRWRPYSMLADFDGEQPSGDWTLSVTDLYGQWPGTINFWSLRLTLGDIVTTTDANGMFVFEGLPPGPLTIRQQLTAQRAPTWPRPTGQTMAEDFADYPAPYVQREAGHAAVQSAQAAYTGSYGLVPGRWTVGTDDAPRVRKGDTISAYLKFPAGAAQGGWVWLGFGAYDGGTLAVAVHPGLDLPGGGPGRLALWQWTGGWDTADVRTHCLTDVAMSGHLSDAVWYRLDIDWGLDNTVVARLYLADGSPATATRAAAVMPWPVDEGTLAFRGKLTDEFPDYYIDSIRLRRDGGQTILASSPLGAPMRFGSGRDGIIAGTVYEDTHGDGPTAGDAGMADVQVYYDANLNGVFDTQASIEENPTVWAVDDCHTVVSEINITGMPGVLRSVAAMIDINHHRVGDLDIDLVSPWGTRVALVHSLGGDHDDYDRIWFRDDAAAAIDEASWPLSEPAYRPQGRLADLVAEDPNGVWRLVVTDHTDNGIEGLLETFSLSLDTGDLAITTDANGVYLGGELPPRWYTLRQSVPDRHVQTYPRPLPWHVLPMGSGGVLWPVDFANARAAAIYGTVWHDVDGDGVRETGDDGVADQQVYLDIDDDGSRDVHPPYALSQIQPVSIVDYRTATSTINLAGKAGRILDVNVHLTISHTYDADLAVYLHSPQGMRVKLFEGVGGSGNGFWNTTLDDEATTPIADGQFPFDQDYVPAEPLAALNGQNANGVWLLEVIDSAGGDEGDLVNWGITLVTGDPAATTGADGRYQLTRVLPGPHAVRLETTGDWLPLDPPSGRQDVTVMHADRITGIDFAVTDAVVVLATYVFYNNSCLDGFDPGANVADNAAIDPTKHVLLPGQGPGPANITGFTAGMVSLIIDVNHWQGPVDLTNFVFRTGEASDPALWTAAPDPLSIIVRLDAGHDGSDRVTILWTADDNDGVVDPQEAVTDRWLEVTFLATPTSGLETDWVFYVANLPADADGNGAVDLDDFAQLKLHFGQTGAGVAGGDFNLDDHVDLDDFMALKCNFGDTLPPLIWAAEGGGLDLLAAAPVAAVDPPTTSTRPRRAERRMMRRRRHEGIDLLADVHRTVPIGGLPQR